MAYSAAVQADSPAFWFRLTEQGGAYSKNAGSDAHNLYAYNLEPKIGFTGIASDGGAVSLLGGASMTAYSATPIVAGSGYTIEGWVYVQGGSPFNPASNGIPLQVAIDNISLIQLGVIANTFIPIAKEALTPTSTTSGSTALTQGWHHLAAARDPGASPALHLYVDGSLAASSSAYSGFGLNENVRLQLISIPTPVDLFVAEPAVYYSTLSAARIAAHAAAADLAAPPRWINRLNGVCT